MKLETGKLGGLFDRKGLLVFPLCALAFPLWAVEVISTNVTHSGTYVVTQGLVVTSTGFLTISAPTFAMLRGAGSVTVDGGRLIGSRNGSAFLAGGALSIINGGAASFSTLGLGFSDSRSQTALIDGAGSNAHVSFLFVGGQGDASLTVSNGAQLVANDTYLGGRPNGGNAGAVFQKKGVLNIGAAEGAAAQAAGQIVSDSVTFTSPNGELVFNHTSSGYTFSAQIISDPNGVTNGVAGQWGTIKVLGGVTRLTGDNSGFAGVIQVGGAALRAGGEDAFGHSSVQVAAGGLLDLASFDQHLAALSNSGVVSLAGIALGTTLTVNGNYVGNNGVLQLGSVSASGPSDRLVIDSPTAVASGHTIVQVTDQSSLGTLTSGNGIEIITALNGATTTAQTTKDAFALAGGHIDAGAYQYRLYAADANGAGENWYLRSNSESGAANYRAEVPLYSALPGQLRLNNLAMLGDLRKRVGEDDPAGRAATAIDDDRRVWSRVISSSLDATQDGGGSPTSSGRLNGLQFGSDILVRSKWRAGLYVGQLEGDANVDGTVGGLTKQNAGKNTLRSRYLGAYGTYTADSGTYVDTVIQSGWHNYTLASQNNHVRGDARSLMVSVEFGSPFSLGNSAWSIEPQFQLIHQSLDVHDSKITGARVKPNADGDWIARAGLRLKAEVNTSAGPLQPYVRTNVYKTSNGTDISRFTTGANTNDVSTSTGGTRVELASGLSLALAQGTSVYGEVGKLWAVAGSTEVNGLLSGSIGLRMVW